MSQTSNAVKQLMQLTSQPVVAEAMNTSEQQHCMRQCTKTPMASCCRVNPRHLTDSGRLERCARRQTRRKRSEGADRCWTTWWWSQVLSPLQRAVLVVESVPAAPDTLALVDAIADMHGEPDACRVFGRFQSW